MAAEAAIDIPEFRNAGRRRTLLSGRLIHSKAELTVDCSIVDLSSAGCRVRLKSPDILGEPLYLMNLTHGLAFRAHVAWHRGTQLGLTFTDYFDLSQADPDRPLVLRRMWQELRPTESGAHAPEE